MTSPLILVTGVSGFSGGYIYQYLRKHGYDVISHWGRATGDLAHPRTYQSWITEFKKQPDIIIHTADQSPDTQVSNDDILKNALILKNVLSIRHIIQYAQKVGIKQIIYLSSDSVYGTDPNRSVLTVNSSCVNPSFYGLVKLVCEGALQESGIPTIALRLPLIVGPGARRNWLVRIVTSIKENRPIVIHTPSKRFNNVIHIENLSVLITHIISNTFGNQKADFSTLLPASLNSLSIREVVDKFARGRVPIIESCDPTPGGPIVIEESLRGLMWNTERALDQFVIDSGLQS